MPEKREAKLPSETMKSIVGTDAKVRMFKILNFYSKLNVY